MRNKLLNSRLSPQERDVLKGKIEAREDFASVRKFHETLEATKVYLETEESFLTLTTRLLGENDERAETKIIARIKEFERLKKKFFKEYAKANNLQRNTGTTRTEESEKEIPTETEVPLG